MADAGVDIAQLTEDQQLALQQFTAVTDQELKDAIPLLQRCQWNVQVCNTSHITQDYPNILRLR
jgi:FAS-associated factor 2